MASFYVLIRRVGFICRYGIVTKSTAGTISTLLRLKSIFLEEGAEGLMKDEENLVKRVVLIKIAHRNLFEK